MTPLSAAAAADANRTEDSNLVIVLVRLTTGDDQRREGRASGPTRRLVHRLVSPVVKPRTE